MQWFDAHPWLQSNPFYVAGDSYAGMMVPVIAQYISEGNFSSLVLIAKKEPLVLFFSSPLSYAYLILCTEEYSTLVLIFILPLFFSFFFFERDGRSYAFKLREEERVFLYAKFDNRAANRKKRNNPEKTHETAPCASNKKPETKGVCY